MERSSSEQILPRSRKFGETELSQKATASAGYGTVAVFLKTRLCVRLYGEQTGICNHRCHAATRFLRRLIVSHTWIALTTWSLGPVVQQGSNGTRTYTTSRMKPNLHPDCKIGMALRSLGSGPQQQPAATGVIGWFSEGEPGQRVG